MKVEVLLLERPDLSTFNFLVAKQSELLSQPSIVTRVHSVAVFYYLFELEDNIGNVLVLTYVGKLRKTNCCT